MLLSRVKHNANPNNVATSRTCNKLEPVSEDRKVLGMICMIKEETSLPTPGSRYDLIWLRSVGVGVIASPSPGLIQLPTNIPNNKATEEKKRK